MNKWIMGATLLALHGAVSAEPADIAAAVADSAARGEENVKLDASRKPVSVLQWAGIEEGDKVLDLFGANLYWAEIIAPPVGSEGRYTIWSASQFYGDEAKAGVAAFEEKHPQVDDLAQPFQDMVLEDGAYDFVIVNLNVHDFWWSNAERGIPEMDPAAHAKEVADALVPGGKLLVIDHRGKPTDDVRAQVNVTHRIDPAAVVSLFVDEGLLLKGTNSDLANPEDGLESLVFDDAIRGKTDRFVHLYVKPE